MIFFVDFTVQITKLYVIVGSQVEGALSVVPENKAVSDGTQSVVLRCHTDKNVSAAISWSRRLVGETSNKGLAILCNQQPSFPSVYGFTSDVPGQCDLTINTVDTSLTGIYICTEQNGQSASAYVTVIGQLFNMLLYTVS